MKITVFGSTGKAGQEVVKQALERGWVVVAYARNPGKFEISSPAFTVIKGELNDLTALEKAIKGSDCVISLLGPSSNVQDTALSSGVKNIIATMEKCGVKRLIQISTPSSSDTNDGINFRFKMMVELVKRTMNGSYEEIVRIGEIVRASHLDWTLVRVPLLNEKPMTKQLQIGYIGQKKLKTALSRTDLAWFMLEQTSSKEFIQMAPVISN